MNAGFTNPLSYLTHARTANGDSLFSLAQFRDLDRSIACAKEYADRPQSKREGHYAQVMTSQGHVVFDTRTP